jgi:hypothetical protein
LLPQEGHNGIINEHLVSASARGLRLSLLGPEPDQYHPVTGDLGGVLVFRLAQLALTPQVTDALWSFDSKLLAGHTDGPGGFGEVEESHGQRTVLHRFGQN